MGVSRRFRNEKLKYNLILQPPTKIVGKVEDDRLDFDYISKDLIYIGMHYVFMGSPPPHINVEVLLNIMIDNMV